MDNKKNNAPIIFFGGSFDPPHLGHEAMIQYVVETQTFDHIVLAPTWNHPFKKQTQADFEHRFEMCEIVAKNFPKVVASKIEKQIQGKGRTLDTLQELQKKKPKTSLRILLGSDQITLAHQWYKFDEIKKMAPPIVLSRPNFPSPLGSRKEMPNLSSTEIRERLKNNQSLKGFVSANVENYIRENDLY